MLKDRGGGQIFSTSFWMRFSQAPLCRYRFKVFFDNIIFLLSGNIIEYICFWCFNSIILTWNKWLGFTKSVIMGWNNISPWPFPCGVVCLPCVIIWLYSTLLPFMRVVGVDVCLSLRMANVASSRRTRYSVVSVYFYCWHCFVLFALFFTQWLIYQFSFHIDILIETFIFHLANLCVVSKIEMHEKLVIFCTVLLREITQNKTDRNISNFSVLLLFLEKVPGKGAFFFSFI